MQEQSFAQLAAEAAAGLKGDRELFLDVTQELETHLEAKEAFFTRQGNSAEESTALAKKAFGSPLDMAAELLAANKGRMRLRSLLRLTLGALVIPLAIVLALYLGYGRFARLQTIYASFAQTVYGFGQNTIDKLPTLPYFGVKLTENTAIDTQALSLAHNQDAMRQLYRYWQAHRNEQDCRVVYANYAELADLGQKRATSDDPAYLAILHLGEQLEPQNALYPLLLTQYYLDRGMQAREENGNEPDTVIDRQAMTQGITALYQAVKQPYLHTYHAECLHKVLNALPRPLLTEDYYRNLTLSCSQLYPEFMKFRDIGKKIPACARLLIAAGKTAEAKRLLDTWKPLTLLLARNSEGILITNMVAENMGETLTKTVSPVYAQLGASTEAQTSLSANQRLTQIMQTWRTAGDSNRAVQSMLDQHAAKLAKLMMPVGAGGAASIEAQLTPLRMHEHVMMEELTVEALLILLVCMLIGALIQGALWLHRLHRAGAVPLLLLPPARVLGRALLFGMALPMVAYWIYSRLPVIGGREFGWTSGMGPRFAVELLIVAALLIWLPAHIIGRYVRRRCDDLAIAIPDSKTGDAVNRIIGWSILAAVICAALALFPLEDELPLLRALVFGLAPGILILAANAIARKSGKYGLYYGTIARSLAPIYALSILVLSFTAQPWLLYQESRWLRQDTIVCGELDNTRHPIGGITSVEEESSKRLNTLLLQAIAGDDRGSGQSSVNLVGHKG
jgi:hypothetical protein